MIGRRRVTSDWRKGPSRIGQTSEVRGQRDSKISETTKTQTMEKFKNSNRPEHNKKSLKYTCTETKELR